LALLVFVASIIVPLIKLIALGSMLLLTRQKSPAFLLSRTRLYRSIDFIGRWAMIDMFMLSILVDLMRFGELAEITPGAGAMYFSAVVILTMIAVSSFDPRLMWDVLPTDESSHS
jgi:paraquat-inducible protein A